MGSVKLRSKGKGSRWIVNVLVLVAVFVGWESFLSMLLSLMSTNRNVGCRPKSQVAEVLSQSNTGAILSQGLPCNVTRGAIFCWLQRMRGHRPLHPQVAAVTFLLRRLTMDVENAVNDRQVLLLARSLKSRARRLGEVQRLVLHERQFRLVGSMQQGSLSGPCSLRRACARKGCWELRGHSGST